MKNRSYLVSAVLLLTSVSALCQTPVNPVPDRGVYPNGGYSLGDQDAINTATGTLTYRIPITSLPFGHGGMTVPVELVYSSNVSDGIPYLAVQSGTNKTVTFGMASSTGIGGWHIGGFSYGLYEGGCPDEQLPTV